MRIRALRLIEWWRTANEVPVVVHRKCACTAAAIMVGVLGTGGEAGHAEAVVSAKRKDPPQQVMVWVEAPRTARIGETFEIVVTVLNARDTAFTFNAVSVSSEYLRGFEVLGIDQPQASYEIRFGDLEIPDDLSIPANSQWQVSILLRAAKVGAYVGDVQIEFDDTSYWRTAQTLVNP